MTPEIHFSPVSKTEDNNRTLFVQIGDLNIPVNNETGETISVGDVVEVWITDAGRNAIRLAGNTTNTDIGVVKEIVDTGEAVVESNGRMKLVDEAEPVNIEEGQTVELLNGVVNQIISDEAIEPSYRRDTETDPAERAEEYLVDPTDNDVTYDDVGGLSRTIEEVKEVVEVPLEENQRETNRFEAHGIEPDSGIVFHGPPGTGKTLLARAVANEVGSSFYLINGPEIINKWYGETEDIIRDIFDHAEEQESAVIFMDEIDSIAPKRSDTRQFQRKIVAQLLTAMDGFDPHSNIVVIGATNELDEVDPALLRSGRFDRKIEFEAPDIDERLDIIQKLTIETEFSEDVDLSQIASLTDGWTGARLSALFRRAVVISIKRDGDAVTSEDLVRALESTGE